MTWLRELWRSLIIALLFIIPAVAIIAWAIDPSTDLHMTKGHIQK